MTPVSERLPEATSPFSARLVIILIAIAIVSFAASPVAPERSRRSEPARSTRWSAPWSCALSFEFVPDR